LVALYACVCRIARLLTFLLGLKHELDDDPDTPPLSPHRVANDDIATPPMER